MHVVRSTCRACDSSELELVLSFGEMPLADALLLPNQLLEEEPRYPLDVVFCRKCSLVQILQTVSPSVLYDESYRYFSSNSDSIMAHSRANAEGLIRDRHLGRDSFVVEIASNDGYMLKNFHEQRIPVLGIDPAPGPAQAARRAGIPTLPTFFTDSLARYLRDEGRQADVILANNVLAHVPDLHGFLGGIRILLKEDGIAVIEVPYVRNLIDECEFDTIYHEHLCYFSVTALASMMRSAGLSLNDVEHFPVHGGSLRLHIGRNVEVSQRVEKYLKDEKDCGLTDFAYYQDFARRALSIKERLITLLDELKADGSRIVGYGAAAKGSTMLNYVGIDDRYLDYVVDRNVHKHGRFMPGVHLPVLAPEQLVEDVPDYALLLAWNFREEVLDQQRAYRERGGRFVVPIPEPTVV